MEDQIEASLLILPHEKLIEILLALDDLEDIFNACRSSTIFARVCQDDHFWKLRYQQDFGSGRPSEEILKEKIPLKPRITAGDSMPWRDFYKLTVGIRRSTPLSAGMRHLGVIDRKGQLNMWGKNLNGQLGNGTTISTKVPQIVLQDVLQVSCGYNTTGAITKNGKVYMWGKNYQGILGTGLNQDNILVPTLVELPKKAIKIDLGYYSSIVLTEDGEVYVWGNIDFSLYMNVPRKLNLPIDDDKAIDVATGESVFAVITRSGKLYMWGGNKFYSYLSKNWQNMAFGIYNPNNPKHRKYKQPILVPFLEPIRQISMGQYHFGIVTRKGKLWMEGMNDSGQIGEYIPGPKEAWILGEPGDTFYKRIIRTLIPIKLPSPVLYFNSRWETSLVKLENGRILMWGNNSDGKIYGQIDPFSIIGDTVIMKPVEISLDYSIVYIMVGGVFTVAITDDDYINLWGRTSLD